MSTSRLAVHTAAKRNFSHRRLLLPQESRMLLSLCAHCAVDAEEVAGRGSGNMVSMLSLPPQSFIALGIRSLSVDENQFGHGHFLFSIIYSFFFITVYYLFLH